jgi:broad specificity phosphatase PhoE
MALTLLQTLFLLALPVIVALAVLALRWRPKRFYMVRHGQTILNEQSIKQGAEGKLNAKGRLQAEHLGIYLKQFPISVILSSPYERAVETAELIAKQTLAPVQTTPLLAERRNPSEVIGKRTDDPEVARIVSLTERGYHEDDFRFSDEENFADMKARARECLAFLEKAGGAATAVVTHHAMLQMLLSYLLYRERLHASDYVKLAYFNPAENAGVTICEYHPWMRFSPTRGWVVIAYSASIE